MAEWRSPALKLARRLLRPLFTRDFNDCLIAKAAALQPPLLRLCAIYLTTVRKGQGAQDPVARFHLKALSAKETEHYIRHRLSVAGMTRAIPFDRKALQRVFEIARGVPRRINLLCDRAMLGAYAHGRHLIDRMIDEAEQVVGIVHLHDLLRAGCG